MPLPPHDEARILFLFTESERKDGVVIRSQMNWAQNAAIWCELQAYAGWRVSRLSPAVNQSSSVAVHRPVRAGINAVTPSHRRTTLQPEFRLHASQTREDHTDHSNKDHNYAFFLLHDFQEAMSISNLDRGLEGWLACSTTDQKGTGPGMTYANLFVAKFLVPLLNNKWTMSWGENPWKTFASEWKCRFFSPGRISRRPAGSVGRIHSGPLSRCEGRSPAGDCVIMRDVGNLCCLHPCNASANIYNDLLHHRLWHPVRHDATGHRFLHKPNHSCSAW